MTTCKEEMKDNKSGAPKDFLKYLDTFMWLKGEPKFVTHFLKWCKPIADDILVGGDWNTLGFDSVNGISNDNNKRPCIGHDRATKCKERKT